MKESPASIEEDNDNNEDIEERSGGELEMLFLTDELLLLIEKMMFSVRSLSSLLPATNCESC